MTNILDSRILKERQKEVDDLIFNRGTIKLYDIKTSFSLVTPDTITLKRKIKQSHTFEILDICDVKERFVVHPNMRIQATENGGTVKILRLEAGYQIDAHFTDSIKGVSGDFGMKMGGSGLNFCIDNTRSHEFKMKLGQLTHEHLVMIIDALPEKKSVWSSPSDKANIIIQYLIISKEKEQELSNAIQEAKMRLLSN